MVGVRVMVAVRETAVNVMVGVNVAVPGRGVIVKDEAPGVLVCSPGTGVNVYEDALRVLVGKPDSGVNVNRSESSVATGLEAMRSAT